MYRGQEGITIKKSKRYPRTKFSPDPIRRAVETFKELISDEGENPSSQTLSIERDLETWEYDEPSEFFSDYRGDITEAGLHMYFSEKAVLDLHIWLRYDPRTLVSVTLERRGDIVLVFEVFEEAAEESRLPDPQPPPEPPWERRVTVFVGHGRSEQWRDLRDFLSDKYGLSVVAYEIGARAGISVKEILEEMLTSSSFAVVVFTGETEEVGGALHARDNVIHELGLFQGYLGFRRAIVLVEEGVEVVSNVSGIHQIRFSPGRIRETFGDVIAALKREFAPKNV